MNVSSCLVGQTRLLLSRFQLCHNSKINVAENLNFLSYVNNTLLHFDNNFKRS